MATAVLVWPKGIVTVMAREWLETAALVEPVALGGREGGVVLREDPDDPGAGPLAPHPESPSARTVMRIPNPLISQGLLVIGWLPSKKSFDSHLGIP